MPGLCAACGAPLMGPLVGIPDLMVCDNRRCLAKVRHLLAPKKRDKRQTRRGGR